jgi:putative intracellular protease/amidase
MNRFTCVIGLFAWLLIGTSVAHADNKGPPQKIAILIFDGVEIIDYSGPYEVFGTAGFEVYTVAEALKPIVTNMGLTVVPKYTFADSPAPDVIVVPGGDLKVPKDSPITLKWIVEQSARSEHTMSVCNGAFLLAKLGLLNDLTATTTYSLLDTMRQRYPSVHVVDNQRFVDSGKIITTAGLSSGIDGALHIVSLLQGPGRAQQTALNMEYNWQPDLNFARAALADGHIPDDFDLNAFGTWKLASTSGDRNHWTMVLQMQSPLNAQELLDKMGSQYAEHGHWGTGSTARNQVLRQWKFADSKGDPWTSTLRATSAAPSSHDYAVTVEVSRAAKS